jgi:hypothetical protein
MFFLVLTIYYNQIIFIFSTKIILISAYDLDSSLVKELEENKYIVKYVEKPIQIPDLMKLVANTKY